MARVAIIVCTRNRVAALPRCLDAIAKAAAGHDVNLIVVDNGSTDETPHFLHEWAKAHRVTLVAEATPGLAAARNAGLFWAAGADIVVFTDDDCVMEMGYIERVKAAFADGRPAIRGGRVLLGDDRDLPITIKLSEEPATYQPGKKPGGFVMGANLAMSRQVVEAVGLFDERFGAGGRFKAAEDTDYLLRASELGFPILYDPSLVVTHYHGRRSMPEARRLAADYSFGDGALYAKHLFNSTTPAKVMKGLVLNTLRETMGKKTPDPIIGDRQFAFRLGHNLRGLASFALGH